MLRRWSGEAYDIELLMSILELVLESIDLESMLKKKPKRKVKLYLKALVAKEMLKLSLRYTESWASLYFNERIPRSTLSYWELNYGFLVSRLLGIMLGLLCLISYDYTVLDSTKFTDWYKTTHETFICTRVKLGEALFPVYASLTDSEVEFFRGVPVGFGSIFADAAFDAKQALNSLVSKGYVPIVKPRENSSRGYKAKIRDKYFNEEDYKLRNVGEGIFGGLTIEFGDRLKTKRKESTNTRIMLRLVVYCLKILARWIC
ncbi:MAG: hypothetical protein QW265_05080, partial [Candidatus Bathyarchaeia archaeon]